MAVARLRTTKFVKKFYSSTWLDDEIVIIPTGVPSEGQLGPHEFPIDYIYEINVFKFYPINGIYKEIGIHTSQKPDGTIIIRKTSLTEDFEGIVAVSSHYYD